VVYNFHGKNSQPKVETNRKKQSRKENSAGVARRQDVRHKKGKKKMDLMSLRDFRKENLRKGEEADLKYWKCSISKKGKW